MKLLKSYISAKIKVGSIIFAMIFPIVVYAQTDTIIYELQQKFKFGLNELSTLCCFADTSFSCGKFHSEKMTDIEAYYEKLNPVLFPQTSVLTLQYYAFFNNLPTVQKENFIRYFSFNEKYFERVLQSAGLPGELKYLAPAFSAMSRNSRFIDGKAGIFQLTHFQALLNGLQVDKMVDERLNVHLATIGFARLISENVEIFGSHELAVLAYIFGNVKMKNALYFAGENPSLNELLYNLPEPGKHYIALFQATAVFLNTNRFKQVVHPFVKEDLPDTVRIYKELHFQQVSRVINIPEELLQFLNPQFKFSIVPGNLKPVKMAVPKGKRDDFVLWQDSIYNSYDSTLFQLAAQEIEYPPAPNRQYLGEPVKDLEIEGKTKIKYRIKTGDVLGIIAEDFEVSVTDLKYWNNITNERKIQAGKLLDIFVDNENAGYYTELASKKNTNVKSGTPNLAVGIHLNSTLSIFNELNALPKLEHVVKSGESPFTIAKKYNGVSPDEILQWNNIDDARKIQIGQKLTIYIKK